MKSKGTENGGKPLWARKSFWVPHFFRPTCFNGQDSVMLVPLVFFTLSRVLKKAKVELLLITIIKNY